MVVFAPDHRQYQPKPSCWCACEDSNSSRISLRKFPGYPTEDPVRFLSDFDAYCKLSRINNTDGRRVAAFQLHLQGSANTWYSCLGEDDEGDWDNLVAAFELNYCVDNTPVLLAETEQFSNLKLWPYQQLEDYYSQVLEKGRKLSKSDQEAVVTRLIGRPKPLCFEILRNQAKTKDSCASLSLSLSKIMSFILIGL